MTEFKVGDFVTCDNGHGAGEGVIWRIVKLKPRKNPAYGRKIYASARIAPVWTATGPSYRKPTTEFMSRIKKLDIVGLGMLRMQLDDLCKAAVAHEAGIAGSSTDETSST